MKCIVISMKLYLAGLMDLVYRIRYYTLRIDRILREYFREFIFLDKFKAKSKR